MKKPKRIRCPLCRGMGAVKKTDLSGNNAHMVTCGKCGGLGKIKAGETK